VTLPLARSTTYGANSQILSADLDLVQDCIVAGRHGQLVRKIPVADGTYSASNGYGSSVWQAAANGNIFTFPLVLYAGERIIAVKVKVSCGATDVISVSVFRNKPLLQATDLLAGPVASVGHAGATEDVLATLGAIELVSSGNDYNYCAVCTVTAFAVAPKIYGAELTYDAGP